jgi:hypothetical protein
VAKHLRVEIVSLEGRMMDVCFWTFEEKEAMMVNEFFPERKSVKDYHVLAVWSMAELQAESY